MMYLCGQKYNLIITLLTPIVVRKKHQGLNKNWLASFLGKG